MGRTLVRYGSEGWGLAAKLRSKFELGPESG